MRLFGLLLVFGGKEIDGNQQQGKDDQTANLPDAEDAADIDELTDVAGAHGDDRKDCQQNADDTFTGNQAGGVENAGLDHVVFLLVGSVLALFQDPAQGAAQHHGHREIDGQIQTNGERQNRNAEDLDDDGDEDAGKDEVPGQVAAHDALDDHLHENRLRGGQVVGTIAAPGHGQKVQDPADGNGGNHHADDLAHLLLFGGGAHQEAGLEVLGGIAGDGCDDADDAANNDGCRHTLNAGRAGGFEQHGGDEQGGDDHAGNGVVGRTDQADHAGGNGGEEEAEDDDDECGEEVQRDGGEQPQHHSDDQHAEEHKRHGNILLGAQAAGGTALAVGFHRVTEGADDEGQGFDEAQHTAAGHGAGADVTQVVAPQGRDTVLGDQFVDGHIGNREKDRLTAEENHQRHDDQPAQHTAGKQVRGHFGAAYVAHTRQGRQDINAHTGAFVGGDVVGDFTGEDF